MRTRRRTVKVHQIQLSGFAYMLFAILVMAGLIKAYWPQGQSIRIEKAQANALLTPFPFQPTSTPTPTPIPVPQGKEYIADYIREVFGQYADRAFLLLTCENSDWVTDIENNAGNTPSDSYDVGLFQVNTHWQGVTNRAFLTDYRINTLMAYSIFSRDGYSFHQWTCGRKLGI